MMRLISNLKIKNDSRYTSRDTRPGFTIVEMLVAMGVFLIFTTASLGIYTSTIRAQKKSIAASRVQQEAQFIMEFLAKMVRTSDIDYSSYPLGIAPSPASDLYIINSNGDNVVFSYDSVVKSITVSVNSGPIRHISSTNITIENLNYYIEPTSSPIPGGGSTPTNQPRATIVMKFQGISSGQSSSLLVQQTVPQRSVAF